VSRHVSSVRRASERQAARVSPPRGRGELGGRKPARQGRLLSVVRLSSISAVAFSLTSPIWACVQRQLSRHSSRAWCLVQLGSFTGSGLIHRPASFDASRTLASPACDGVPRGGHLLVLQKTKFKHLRRGDLRTSGSTPGISPNSVGVAAWMVRRHVVVDSSGYTRSPCGG
jgi:hypothetical protein